jgi:guanylate kinase
LIKRDAVNSRGKIFILSGPSGVGKSTLTKALLDRFPDICYSVSYTTRLPRKGEKDGVDYHFIEKKKFEKLLESDQWAEWANVHGNFYGTSRSFIEKKIEEDRDVLLEIDIQGTRQIMTQYPESITIFVAPPTWTDLETRLKSRGTDPDEVIERRLTDAKKEVNCRKIYQHMIVNDNLEAAKKELIKLIEHYKTGK